MNTSDHPLSKLVEILQRLGHLPAGTRAPIEDEDIEQAVYDYAEFHGIEEQQSVEALAQQVERHAELPRCGVPDVLAFAAGECAWQVDRIKCCCAISALSGLKTGDILERYVAAMASWSEVCGIEMVLTNDEQAANIVTRSGHIDGPGRTLAVSYLPCGAVYGENSQLSQTFDDREPWSGYGLPMLQEVFAHEFGHALGIEHLTAPALMAPMATGNLVVPQPPDVAQSISRYGVSDRPQPPGPMPPPAAGVGQPIVLTKDLRYVGQPLVYSLLLQPTRRLYP